MNGGEGVGEGRRNPTHTHTHKYTTPPPKTHIEKNKDLFSKESYSLRDHTENSKQFKNTMKD